MITNPTAEAITVTPSVYEDPSDAQSDNASSTDGDNVADLSDTWYTTFDSLHIEGDSEPSAVYTKFWGTNPAQLNSFAFNDDYNSDEVEFAPITIAPGESYNWIFFHSYRAYTLSTDSDAEVKNAADVAAAVAAGEAAVAEFRNNGSTLPASGRLIRGLNLEVESNWDLEVLSNEPEAPTLANTGSSDLVLGFAGITLIALGAASVVFTRRQENA